MSIPVLYTGSLHNESGVLVPIPPPAILLADLEADQFALNDGDLVALWADQSGNGHDFTASGGARPTYHVSGGVPYVSFDGIGNWMDGGDFADNLDNFAVFAIVRDAASSGFIMIVNKYEMLFDWQSHGWRFYIQFANLTQWSIVASLDNVSSLKTSDINQLSGPPFVAQFEKIGSDQLIVYANEVVGNQHAGSVESFSTIEHVLLGKEGGENGVNDVGYSQIDLCALRIYQIVDYAFWNKTSRAAITAELAARYGVTIIVTLLDLEADTLILNDGDLVATWADQSGNDNDAVRGAGSNGLTKQTNNGKAYVQFNSVDDWMLCSNFADNLDSFTVIAALQGGSPTTDGVFAICKIQNANISAGWIAGFSTVSLMTQEDGGNNYMARDHAIQSYANPFIMTWEFASQNDLNLYFNSSLDNGNLDDSGPVSDMSNTEPVRIGTDGRLLNFASMKLSAVRIYTPALSPAGRAAKEAELAARYGITL